MNNTATQTARPRRSRVEVATLVAEFDQSGLSGAEYCRQHGLSLSTFNRHRKNARVRSSIGSGLVTHAGPAVSLMPVEVLDSAPDSPRSALSIECAGGRRIGVDTGFDADTLRRLIAVIEGA